MGNLCTVDSITAIGLVNPSLYYKMMVFGAVIFVLVLAAFVFAYFYLLKRKDNDITTKAKLPWLPIILFSGLALRLAISIPAPGVDIDIGLFINWANAFANHGLSEGYNYASSIDYPPGYMYCLYAVGMVAKLLKVASNDSMYLLLIKLPPIIADIAIGFLIYKLCGNKVSQKIKLFFVAVWIFNPVVILDSAVWGQVDSVLALLLLVAIYFITKKKFILSSIVFAVALSVKPQALILIPILGYALIKEIITNWRNLEVLINKLLLLFACLGVAISTFIIVILPYTINQPRNWIFDLYLGTTGHYDYATVNAFNFFYLIKTNWIKDSGSFMGTTYFIWGMISIVVSACTVWWLYQKSRTTNPYVIPTMPEDVKINKKKYRGPGMYINPDDESHEAVPYLLASTLLFLVVTFGPRMHERYFFPMMVLLLMAVIKSNNKYLLLLYTGITTASYFSVLEILTDLNLVEAYKDNKYTWPDLYAETLYPPRFFMSLFNVIFCVALLIFAFLYAYNKFTSDKNKIWSVNYEKNN